MATKSDLTIVCFSDTHTLHRSLDMPAKPDLVICAGDFTFFDRDTSVVNDFNLWLGELGSKHKPIVIYGNHERRFEADPLRRKLLYNAHVLMDEAVEIEGLTLWGSPVTSLDSTFGLANPMDRKKLFATIPDDTDVIITHGPPAIPRQANGDPVLFERVMEIQPLIHIFGHEHQGSGMQQIGETLFVNCALLGPGGGIEHEPIVLRLPRL